MVTVDPPRAGPCSHWATPEDVALHAGLNVDDIDPDLLDVNLTNATEVLFRKSGSQWVGLCAETVRPVTVSSLAPWGQQWWQQWGYPYTPELVAGQWFNLGGPVDCGGRNGVVWDSGMQVAQVDLGQYPVTEITAVKIDGGVLDPAHYRLDRWHLLTRTDGKLWPVHNNLLLDDSQPGTWSVGIKFGVQPPQLGVTACAVLAAELTRFCVGDDKCRLPLRATAITGKGVTYSLANVMDLIDKGRIGLYMVDLFCRTVNPNDLDRPARVLTPDIRGPRRLG